MITLYSDGLVEPVNPGGWGCWAWVAVDEAGAVIAHDCGTEGRGPHITNNRMEYIAAGKALRWARDNGHTGVTLRTDSQLVVNQILGNWQCNKPHLRRLRDRARELVAAVGATVEWVPRAQNELADSLSREAYRRARAS